MGAGPGGGDGYTVDRATPDEVFQILASANRMDILRALMEEPERTISFSELFDAVEMDDAGQMNYHLSELLDIFVQKSDDGYQLNFAGRRILGTIYAGSYTASATVDPQPVEATCWQCDGPVVVEYADEQAGLRCQACDYEFEWFFPPGSIEEFDDEIPEVFDIWHNYLLKGVLAGFCPICVGRMDGELILDGGEETFGGFPAHAEFECGRCAYVQKFLGITPAMLHPVVEGFLVEHVLGVEQAPIFWGDEIIEAASVEVRSVEPPRLAVQFTVDEASVVAVIDADATVVEVDRSA